MLDHAGMLEKTGTHLEIDECRRDPERTWEDWKEQEGRHRYVQLIMLRCDAADVVF